MVYAVFVVGIVALVGGAELLVRGASMIATRTGLSSVVIGLTVVALGTSSPELAVSVGAALRGETQLAVGNVVGSNIANVLLVLGLSAAVGVGGLAVARKLVQIDVPIMIGVSILVLVLAIGGLISRLEGLLLSIGLIVYIVWTVLVARRVDPDDDADGLDDETDSLSPSTRPAWMLTLEIGAVGAGLLMLVIGAAWLVSSASDIAARFGVSDLVIGLTVVAFGTSAPELATSLIAAVRGERDLAVGNAVGSNLFNLLGVLGVTAMVSSDGLPVSQGALRFDLPVMVLAAIGCLPVFLRGHRLTRLEGAIFFAAYLLYISLVLWMA